MPEVRCSVSNCSFWGQGNFCQASAIIVQPDADETGQTENDSYTAAVLTNETLESSVVTRDCAFCNSSQFGDICNCFSHSISPSYS